MSKITIIDEILSAEFKASNQLQLIEENFDNQSRRFTFNYPIVKNAQTECLLYRYDPNGKNLFPFFSSLSGLRKICDYILFAEADNYLYVFLIELKKGKMSAQKQLTASEEFIKYIINSANRIGKQIDDNVVIRKIRMSDKKIKKINTKIKETDFQYVNNYCDYKYQKFYLAPLMHY